MANTNRPDGFKPVRYLGGTDFTGACNWYRKEASVILGIGDSVVLAGSASVKGTNNADATGIPTVTRAATTGTITGVVMGCAIDTANSGDRAAHTKHMAAADTGYVLVCDAPEVIFEIQDDGASGPLAVGDVGNGVTLATIANADTATGLSTMKIDATSGSAGTQLQLMRLVQRPDNAIGAYARWEVRVNAHTYKPTATLI